MFAVWGDSPNSDDIFEIESDFIFNGAFHWFPRRTDFPGSLAKMTMTTTKKRRNNRC